MTTENLNNILEKMTTWGFGVSLLLNQDATRESGEYFEASGIAYGIHKSTEKYPGLKEFNYGYRDNGTPYNAVVENIISSLRMSNALEFNCSWTMMKLVKDKEYLLRRLLKEEGKDLPEKIKPVTDEVWKWADEYIQNRKDIETK